MGTIIFDIVGFALTQQWWDIPQLLGGALGVGLFGGVLAHYANGILIAWIYAGVGLFMMPLLGMGIMGLKAGMMMPVIGTMRHWAYGAALARMYPINESAPAGRATATSST